jgi:hypothetical protein
MKRKSRKSVKRGSKQRRSGQRRKSEKKRRSARKIARRLYSPPKNERQSLTQQKALAALARMRRQGFSLARATRLERIKPSTFLGYVGSAVHRNGPGKPWKATKADRLSAKMTILTENGPLTVLVRGSRERTLLARYDIALRKWREGQDGAERELRSFKGRTVAGRLLITDLDLLIQLEEAGQLDFDSLYFSVGGGA